MQSTSGVVNNKENKQVAVADPAAELSAKKKFITDVIDTIILDLDGTLIAENDDIHVTEAIILRPHLKYFLDFCFENFKNVHIWTAASPNWAYKVLKALPRQDFHKLRTGCSRGKTYYPSNYCYYSGDHENSSIPYKKLTKYYNKHRTIIVDNTPSSFRKNYGNAVYIPTFDGFDQSDEKLLDIKDELIDLKNDANKTGSVRKVSRITYF